MRKWLILIFFIYSTLCTVSPFLQKRYITFNYIEEGFLDKYTLQSIAHIKYQSKFQSKNDDIKKCFQLARKEALKRMLRMILHVYFDLKVSSIKQKSREEFHSYQDDYPYEFEENDYQKAKLAWPSLLKKAKVILQENRRDGMCMLVYRIEDKRLLFSITSARLDFKPKIISK